MAGGFDRNWNVGGKSRGTRSEFRLEGLQPFKCTYPVPLANVMEAGQSTQTGLERPEFVTSPFRGETRTRAVREYEQTIDQLRKENFDLKLRIFLYEEDYKKRNQTQSGEETENTLHIIIDLKLERENLRAELREQNQALQNALEQAENYARELRELQDKLFGQDELLSVVEQLPSTEEYKQMQDHYYGLIEQNESLAILFSEKEKEIEEANTKLKELTTSNEDLVEKVKKRDKAIKGCVMKYYRDIEMIPNYIRPIVISAVDAAKNNNETDMFAAIENLKASLCQMMPESLKVPSANNSSGDTHKQCSSEDVVTNLTNKSSDESVDYQESQSSNAASVHLPVMEEISAVDEDLEEEVRSYIDTIMEVLNENEYLKKDSDEKLKIINNLQHNLKDVHSKAKSLKLLSREGKSQSAVFSKDSTTQTDIQWCMLQSKLSDKNIHAVGNSNNIEELKEEILMLLLAIGDKDNNFHSKEDTFSNIDMDFSAEREELHRRLAISCSLNNKLLKQLQSFEGFLEELLEQKRMSTSSLENINDTTDFFFSQLSRCLDESLKLSCTLSDQLSLYEGNKIFDASDVSVNKEDFVNESKSCEQIQDSHISQNESDVVSASQEGMNNFFASNNKSNINSMKTGKRRLPFSTLQKPGADSTLANPDNVVILKTSNNEDLILLLNEQGDPEDVLIRNNHSLLDQSADGNQFRRRCWDASLGNTFWNKDTISAHHYTENVYNTAAMSSLKLGSARHNSWMSSDSDTWSEPDRNVSMQRIGIDVQSSPANSRSPRKSRFRDRKGAADDASSSKNESASSYVKLHSWSKRRKSGETTKMTFICKKCLRQSQQSDMSVKEEKNSTNLQEIRELSNINENQQKELKNLHKEIQTKIECIELLNKEKKNLYKEKNNLTEEKNNLSTDINNLKEELHSLSDELRESDKSNKALKDISNVLKEKLSASNTLCEELESDLKQTKKRLVTMNAKCAEFEEKISLESKNKEEYEEIKKNMSKNKEEYEKKFKILEHKEAALLDEIKGLTLEKNNLLSKVKSEENENLALTKTLEESVKKVSELQACNQKLEKIKTELSKEKSTAEFNLVTAHSQCETLNTDLITLQENMKSKCDSYEKEVHLFSSTKKNILKKLLNFKDTFVVNLNMLNSLCGMKLELDEGSFEDIPNTSQLSDQDMGNKIDKLIHNISKNNSQFKELIGYFTQQIQNIRRVIQETESASEEEKRKATFAEQQLELKENEIQSLNKKILVMQNCIEELKNAAKRCNSVDEIHRRKISSSLQELEEKEQEIKNLKENNGNLLRSKVALQNQVADSEKSLKAYSLKNDSSQKQLALLEKGAERDKNLLISKDEEIARLQKRISNLQAQVTELTRNKINSSESSPRKLSTNAMNVLHNSNLESNHLDESNESFVSVESENRSKSFSVPKKEHDKYLKKIKSLQTKLEMRGKRIEILEKEMSNLREDLLSFSKSNIGESISPKDINAENEKFAELEAKLATKDAFIQELKEEMYKTHDTLIDRQKENNRLQRELFQYKNTPAEDDSKVQLENIPNRRLSDPLLLRAEANISDLRKQKKEHINTLLNLQKQFYNKKNIHMRHIENFIGHIESLRALQVHSSLVKSESAPLLNISLPCNIENSRQWDRILKNIQIDLEIDIECLQSLEIFINRFFAPVMLQSCQVSNLNPGNDSSPGPDGVQNPEKKDIGIQTALSAEKNSEMKRLEVSNLSFEMLSGSLDVADDSSHDRLLTTASSISRKLDWMERTLKNIIEEFYHFSETDSGMKESSRKTAAKSILQKLYEGLCLLRERADEVFCLNSALKSLELFASDVQQGTSRQDISDRESLLSEETITLSRSESLSPVSFDEQFPSRYIHLRMIEKDHTDSYQKHSDVNKRSSHKLISSSQDSVFQRSHYSSPDLGIESDPNHEHSAPEQTKTFHPVKDSIISRHDLSSRTMQKTSQDISSIYSFGNSGMRLKDEGLPFTIGETLRAIGVLQEYELLKQEVAESLVGIKSVLSRTGEGLHHIASYTSPRKKLEYSTFRAIKDTCAHIEVCLQNAHKLVQNFWVAPCPTEEEIKMLLQYHEELNAKLKRLYESKKKQGNDFKDVMEKLKQAEIIKEKQDLKITKKLSQTYGAKPNMPVVKHKKVLRQVEKVMIEKNNNTELPLFAKETQVKKA